MIETGEVRKLFTGPPEVVATLIHPARVLLGVLKNDMAFNSLLQGERRLRVPVNQRLLAYGDSPERTTEVRAQGIAEIAAGSRFGQDWIAIDASAVTITTVTQPQSQVQVPPFFRVLVRDDDFPINNPLIVAWEPYRATEATEAIGAQFGSGIGVWVKQGVPHAETDYTDSDNNFRNEDHYKLWLEYPDLPAEEWVAEYWTTSHTTAGLYCAVYDAYPDHFAREYEEEAYRRYIVLDPDDPEKTSPQPDQDVHPPHAVGGFPHQVQGTAQSGWYVIKVFAHSNQHTVRVEIGNPVEKFDFTIPGNAAVTAGDILSSIFPSGDNDAVHSIVWWQGALLINPMDGVIAFVKDGPLLPHWGFTDSVIEPPDLSGAEFHYHSMSQKK